MAWVAWVHKILAWVTWVTRVEILAWVAWVHKALAWVAWVEIFAWVRKKVPTSCYLIILYRKHYVFYRTLYNCTNRIHQALQHTYFISYFQNSNETCVWFIIWFIFKFALPRLFFKLWLSHLLNIQKQSKHYERAECEETKRFKRIPLLDVLNSHQTLFFANAYSIYYSHIYNKTDRKVKPTIVNDYCTFGASITEVQIRYKWSSRMETRTQGQKNTLSVICNSVSPWSKNLFETHLFGFHFYVTLWTVNNASLF